MPRKPSLAHLVSRDAVKVYSRRNSFSTHYSMMTSGAANCFAAPHTQLFCTFHWFNQSASKLLHFLPIGRYSIQCISVHCSGKFKNLCKWVKGSKSIHSSSVLYQSFVEISIGQINTEVEPILSKGSNHACNRTLLWRLLFVSLSCKRLKMGKRRTINSQTFRLTVLLIVPTS